MAKVFHKQNLKKIEWFFSSYYYPIFMFAVVLLTHTLALDILGFIITVLCFVITTLLCEDLRPSVPFILMFPYVVSTQNSPGYTQSDYYQNPTIIKIIIALGILIVLALLIRVIIKKEYRYFFNFKSKNLLLGFLLLIPCYALAGLFSGWVEINSLMITAIMIALQPIIYIIFSSGLHSKEDNILYFAKVATLAVVLMCLEILLVYLLKYQIGTPLNSNWKGEIIVGSVVSNSAGEFIVILLPFLFYLAYKEKHGYIYYIIASLSFIAIYFTLSRASLLFYIPTFILGSIILCFKGKYKNAFRIISVSFITILFGAILYLILSKKADFIFEFFKHSGSSDRGRFKLWKEIFGYFKASHLFGVGFSTHLQSSNGTNIFQCLAHNTAVQILCSTGIIGTLLFLYHIFEVVKTFFLKITFERFIVGVSVALFLLISLLDQIFFFPNFTVIYTLLLVFAEKDAIKTV